MVLGAEQTWGKAPHFFHIYWGGGYFVQMPPEKAKSEVRAVSHADSQG